MRDQIPHLVVLHSAARCLPGYAPADAPSIGLEGPAFDPRSEFGRATLALADMRGEGTLGAEIAAGAAALRAAGVPRRFAKEARKMAEHYFFGELGLAATTRTREPKCRMATHAP